MRKLAVILISAVTAFSGALPAHAFPGVSAPKVEVAQQAEKVQWRDGWRRGGPRYRYYRHGRHHGHYYRRHRHHHGHAGAIIGGLAAGAIIGGALAQPRYVRPHRYAGASSHTQWCYGRYRSYRAFDNTYQPYGGPRRQCYSPYN
jgi:hypothetical protein